MCSVRGESEMIYWRRSHDFEIVNLLDNGQTPKQVAMELAISIWTVYRACKRYVDGKSEKKQPPKQRINLTKYSSLSDSQKFKSNARAYANTYLRRGAIKKEKCRSCGKEQTEMHHSDYNKPLDIIWVCRRCHMNIHRGIDSPKNAKEFSGVSCNSHVK